MVEELYKNIREIKSKAIEDNVPIILDDSLDFLTNYIEKKKITNILEIGTAVGYSAIMMSLSSPDVNVTTIEKDKDRYLEAVKNVKKMGLEERIVLIYSDALEVKLKDKFDLIFIDASKSKNREIFDNFESNLLSKGSVITDNINFHGYVKKDLKEIDNYHLKGLVKKIRKYISFLEDNLKYKTTFYDIGDGLSVSEKRI